MNLRRQSIFADNRTGSMFVCDGLDPRPPPSYGRPYEGRSELRRNHFDFEAIPQIRAGVLPLSPVALAAILQIVNPL